MTTTAQTLIRKRLWGISQGSEQKKRGPGMPALHIILCIYTK